MNFALFANPILVAPLQSLVRWLTSDRSPVTRPGVGSMQPRPATAPELIAACAVSTGVECQKVHATKPLRVVRVVEAGQTRSCVGRMVISGRMADVCAELDRLVAREAALGCGQAI
jgi:hypothetical protein